MNKETQNKFTILKLKKEIKVFQSHIDIFEKESQDIQFCMNGYTGYFKDHKQIIKTLLRKIEGKKIKYAGMNIIIYKGSSINNSGCFIL